MGLLDLILPTPATQQEQLTTLIQKQITDTMSSSKFSSASAVTQTANITAVGAGSVNSGVNIQQVANINVSAFLNDATALNLKSDLKNNLTNSIKNQASNMPLGQQQNVNTKIASVVDKSIETKFSHDAMMELNNAVNQAVNVAAVAGGVNTDISVYQKADVITKFSNSVATDIATQLVGSDTVSNTSDTKTTNFLSETIGAIGGAIASVLAGAWAGPVMMFAMFMAVVLIGIWIVRGGGSHPMPPRPPTGGVGLENLGIDLAKLPPVGGR
jgi:hypothetical protein